MEELLKDVVCGFQYELLLLFDLVELVGWYQILDLIDDCLVELLVCQVLLSLRGQFLHDFIFVDLIIIFIILGRHFFIVGVCVDDPVRVVFLFLLASTSPPSICRHLPNIGSLPCLPPQVIDGVLTTLLLAPVIIAVASEVGIDTSSSRMGNALSRRTVRSR